MKKEFDDIHALYQNFLGTLRANLEQLEGVTSKHVSVINGSSQITDDNAEGGSRKTLPSILNHVWNHREKKTVMKTPHRIQIGMDHVHEVWHAGGGHQVLPYDLCKGEK